MSCLWIKHVFDSFALTIIYIYFYACVLRVAINYNGIRNNVGYYPFYLNYINGRQRDTVFGNIIDGIEFRKPNNQPIEGFEPLEHHIFRHTLGKFAAASLSLTK